MKIFMVVWILLALDGEDLKATGYTNAAACFAARAVKNLKDSWCLEVAVASDDFYQFHDSKGGPGQ